MLKMVKIHILGQGGVIDDNSPKLFLNVPNRRKTENAQIAWNDVKVAFLTVRMATFCRFSRYRLEMLCTYSPTSVVSFAVLLFCEYKGPKLKNKEWKIFFTFEKIKNPNFDLP